MKHEIWNVTKGFTPELWARFQYADSAEVALKALQNWYKHVDVTVEYRYNPNA